MDKYFKVLNVGEFKKHISNICQLDSEHKKVAFEQLVNRNKRFALVTRASKLMQISIQEVNNIINDPTQYTIFEAMIKEVVCETVAAIKMKQKLQDTEDELIIKHLTQHETGDKLNEESILHSNSILINYEKDNENEDDRSEQEEEDNKRCNKKPKIT